MALYMAVTADKYELPLMVTNNGREMADIYGIKYESLMSQISKKCSGKKLGVKFVKVQEEEE